MAVCAFRVAARAGRGRFALGQTRRFADGKLNMPGVIQAFDGTVYVALTNEMTAKVTTFTFPDGSHFDALPGDKEPTGEQAAQLALNAIKGMKSHEADVVFCGSGEPLARAPELIRSLQHLKDHSGKFNKVTEMRLDTNGLVKAENATSMANFLKDAGLNKAVVELQTADAKQYEEVVGPLHGLTHSDATTFVTALVNAGVTTQISAVDKPGVDLAAVEALATKLGATFVKRTDSE